MCELELELIVKITAYNDDEIYFLHHFHDEVRVITPDQYAIKEGCEGMPIILTPFSAKYTHSSSDSRTDTKVKNTISYNSLLRIKDIKNIVNQVKELKKRNYNLLVETLSEHKYIIRSTPDTFLYQQRQEGGHYVSTITIENISGAQLILAEE